MMLIKIKENTNTYYFSKVNITSIRIHPQDKITNLSSVIIYGTHFINPYGTNSKDNWSFSLTPEELKEFQESCER